MQQQLKPIDRLRTSQVSYSYDDIKSAIDLVCDELTNYINFTNKFILKNRSFYFI